MAAMSFEEWLPAPGHARGSHLIDFVEALLVRCEDLAEGRDWAQVAVDARGVLDAIRSAVAAEAPGIAVFDFASEFVHAHLTTVGAAFDGVDPSTLHVHPVDMHPNGRAHERIARALESPVLELLEAR